MSEQPKVSVIVPVYNVEKYLEECLDSILGQTLKDIEVICADDGSTDGSVSILERYMDRDPRLQLIRQPENMGGGAARNAGLAISEGEYVIFLDSDDFFASEMLEKLFRKAEDTRADIVLFDGQKYNDSTGEYIAATNYLRSELLEDVEVFSRADFPEAIMTITNPAPWTKFYRHSFIQKNGLQFQCLPNSNDLYFTMLAMCIADRITYVPEILVNYRIGMTQNTQSRKDRDPTCFLTAYGALYDELNARGIYDEVYRSYITLTVSGCIYNLNTIKSPEALDDVNDRLVSQFFPHTGLLDYPDDIYVNPKNVSRLRGIRYIQVVRTQTEARLADTSRVLYTPDVSGAALVSVIIPIYNTEKYLRACLDSIITQTLNNIEIICINDGSPDGSLTIAEEYAQKDVRIKVFSQENKGLSAARNAGVKYAQGEYLYFMDSDDLLRPDALQTLYERASRDSLDVVFFDGTSFADEEISDEQLNIYRDYYIRTHEYDGVFSGETMLFHMEKHGEYRSSVCLQMTKRAFFLKNELWFLPGVLHEDNAYTFKSILLATRVGYCGEPFFNRRVRANSIMSSQYTYRNALGYFICYLDMLRSLECSTLPMEHKREITMILYRILHNARNIHRQLPEPEKYAYLGLSQDEQILYKLYVLESTQGTDLFSDLKKQLQLAWDQKSEINATLQRTYAEKSEINATLQRTYAEKSEINATLQRTYAEKSEINATLQRTYKEKSEINAKLQQTYAEKTERGIQIKELEAKLVKSKADNKKLKKQLAAEKKKLKQLKSSSSYRIGRIITWPVRKLKALFRKTTRK